jgi:hypothetical protein
MNDFRIYKRLITANELLYIRFNEKYGQFNIQFIFEGQGSVSKETMQLAIEKSTQSNPIICSCIQGKYWAYSGQLPAVIEHNDIYSLNDIIHSNILQENMDLESKTAEVHLFNGGSLILFKIFHGIMDGKGATSWAANVFRALRGEDLFDMSDVISEKEFVLSTGVNAPSLDLDFCFLPFKNYQSPYKGEYKWHTEKIEGNFAMLISHICHFFTQNNVLDQAKFMIPVDLRRHNRKLNSDCNLTLPIFVKTEKSMSVGDIHGEYLFTLKDNLELSVKNTEVPGISVGGKFMADIGIEYLKLRQLISKRFLATGIISFLGSFKNEQFSTPTYQNESFYAFPSYQPLTPFNIIPIQIGNITTLTITYSTSLFDESEIQQVMLELKKYLLSTEK